MKPGPKPRAEKKPIFVRFEISAKGRLEALAKQYGYTVPAIIRACVSGYLPELEKWLKANKDKPVPR